MGPECEIQNFTARCRYCGNIAFGLIWHSPMAFAKALLSQESWAYESRGNFNLHVQEFALRVPLFD